MVLFCFALVPCVIGLLAPVWFGRMLPPVRKLRKGATWLDPKDVQPPSITPLTVQALREHDKCGDKVVVAHHLSDWTRDLERKIFQTLGINTVIAFVLVIISTVKNDKTLQAPTVKFQDIFEAVKNNWPISLVLAGSLIEILIFVKLVSDQAFKYRRVIEAAKPAPTPLRARLRIYFAELKRNF